MTNKNSITDSATQAPTQASAPAQTSIQAIAADQTPNQSSAGAQTATPNQAQKGSTLAKQGLAYLIVGGSSALIELALFQMLYQVVHAPVALSNVCAIAVAATFNFLINRNVTFKSTSNPTRSLILYLCLLFMNMGLTSFIIAKLIGLGLPSLLAKLFTQGFVVCWNFVLYKTVIFK